MMMTMTLTCCDVDGTGCLNSTVTVTTAVVDEVHAVLIIRYFLADVEV